MRNKAAFQSPSKTAIVVALLVALPSFLTFIDAQVSPEVVAEGTIRPLEHQLELPYDRGVVGLWQSLRKLRTRASLLMITAHPDDEDGALLTLESRGRGTRTGLLCLTRGEGGANVMSDDFFDALGMVRTEELLAASRYYGATPYWSRAVDYGFSKTREEAFEEWGYDRVLSDVVRVVRMTRPLVIASVFIGGATDGHGNHQTTGQIAQEAFVLAGDPDAFPEQLEEGLRPWKPLKVYARVPSSLREGSSDPRGLYNYATQKWSPAGFQNYVTDTWTEGALPTTVEVDSGNYDALLGLNYQQVAREGLGLQKSQTGGTSIPPAGVSRVPYHRFASRVESPESEASIFEGIDIRLPGIADLVSGTAPEALTDGFLEIDRIVARAMDRFPLSQPEKVGADLAAGLALLRTLIEKVDSANLLPEEKLDVLFELRVKERQFNDALLQSLGLSILAVVGPEDNQQRQMFRRLAETFQTAIPGQEFSVSISVTNQSRVTNEAGGSVEIADAKLKAVDPSGWNIVPEASISGPLEPTESATLRFRVSVPEDVTYTRPYFSRPSIAQAFYDVEERGLLGQSRRPYPLTAWVDLKYSGVDLRLGQVVQTVRSITGIGTVLEPLVVGPPISVSLSPPAGVISIGAESFTLKALVRSSVKGPATGTLGLRLPAGWRSEPQSAPFQTERDGAEQSVVFRVFPADIEDRSYRVQAVATYQGREYTVGYEPAGYAGLRPYNLYREATHRTRGVDVVMADGLKVGYVTGTGDSVPEYLTNLGVEVTFLTEQDLASGDLSRFDVVLLGVRTYAARPELETHNGRLLEYVQGGGVVVVQYNTPEYDENFGPYPYEMTSNPEEVTDERSPVHILMPDHPVLTWPNRITERDFEGWVEQRGSKFMKTWDSRYQALIETHDAGQDLQEGGFLYARYGKGAYVYCAYAFYRQLPEGVPGAYRLIANLLSLPRNPALF